MQRASPSRLVIGDDDDANKHVVLVLMICLILGRPALGRPAIKIISQNTVTEQIF